MAGSRCPSAGRGPSLEAVDAAALARPARTSCHGRRPGPGAADRRGSGAERTGRVSDRVGHVPGHARGCRGGGGADHARPARRDRRVRHPDLPRDSSRGSGFFPSACATTGRATSCASSTRRPSTRSWRAMRDSPPVHSFMFLEAITGRARDEPRWRGLRPARSALERISTGIWEDPADDDAQIAWVAPGRRRCSAVSFSGAGYGNYASVDEPAERVRAGFSARPLRPARRRQAPLRPRQRLPLQPQHPAGGLKPSGRGVEPASGSWHPRRAATSRVSRPPPARATSCFTRSSASPSSRSQRRWSATRALVQGDRRPRAAGRRPRARSTVRRSSASAASKERRMSGSAGSVVGSVVATVAPRRIGLGQRSSAAPRAYRGRCPRPRRPRRCQRPGRRAPSRPSTLVGGRRKLAGRDPEVQAVPGGASAGSRTIAASAARRTIA